MIQNLTVGPPKTGIPEFQPKESARDARNAGSDSFERTLEEKTTSKMPAKDQGPPETSSVKVEKTSTEPKAATRIRETDDPRPAESPPKMVEPVTQKKAATAREKAIQDFMDSFESEFGIPPTRIVEAMANLKPSQMNEAPEVTADAVIEQLDLDDSSQDKAAAMYVALLSQLQKIDQVQKSPTPLVDAHVMESPQIRERFAAAQERRMTLNRSLDQLNQKFWMKDSRPAAALPNEMPIQAGMTKNFPVMASFEDDGVELSESMLDGEMPLNNWEPAPELPGTEAPIGEEPVLRPSSRSPQDLQRLLADMKRKADVEVLGKAQARPDVENAAALSVMAEAPVKATKPLPPMADMKAVTPNGSEALMQTMAKQPGQQGMGFAGQQNQSSEFFPKPGKSSSASSKSNSVGSDSGALSGLGATPPVPLKMEDVVAALKSAAPAAAAAPFLKPEDNAANVRQLMNQAQYLVKNGGGEVKVQMNPEGLGQVHLKVLLQDGKVNVQMAAESSEAKKAIESSLPELRSSLAAHKLSVDHVKVDVVSATNTENQARPDMNFNTDGQREQTRQFWNQFQENFGNRGFRDGMMDVSAQKAYRQSRQDPLEPLSTSTASKRKSLDEGKGNGLNLVA